MSSLIAIEGLDGAGKSTQIQLLQEYLSIIRIRSKVMHFPRSGLGIYGRLIASFLRGEYGDVRDVHPQLVSLLYAGDRKEHSGIIEEWLREGYYVLVDRYVISNIAFQCAKVSELAKKETLENWIEMFEYQHNQIPKPNVSIYLDVPLQFVQSSLERKRVGPDRAYLQGKNDIHEADISLQKAVMAEYERIVSTHEDVVKISCTDACGRMLDRNTIHKRLLVYIEQMV